jgi:hypothetical protein
VSLLPAIENSGAWGLIVAAKKITMSVNLRYKSIDHHLKDVIASTMALTSKNKKEHQEHPLTETLRARNLAGYSQELSSLLGLCSVAIDSVELT